MGHFGQRLHFHNQKLTSMGHFGQRLNLHDGKLTTIGTFWLETKFLQLKTDNSGTFLLGNVICNQNLSKGIYSSNIFKILMNLLNVRTQLLFSLNVNHLSLCESNGLSEKLHICTVYRYALNSSHYTCVGSGQQGSFQYP